MIDTHCHLTFPDFSGIVGDVLARAREHGVSGVITVGTTTANAAENLVVAHRFPSVWSSAGVHPLYSHEGPHDWAALGRAIADPRCVAWGELGLDNHYDDPPRSLQDKVLADQLAYIESVQRGGVEKPVIIHCREAFDDLLPVLAGSALDLSRVVFHCFTGTPDDARKVLDQGAWISFTGVATYRNAGEVRKAARLVPADRIMVETDAPFLSPDPHRGARPCEPWMSSVTARRLAQERGVPWEVFHDQINQNTTRFFGIPAA
ncbi:MAG: TatD family hydrolase [Phycisphaeraceae bacterium]|nr:TatD family hydrolase [Phycisphaerae bacterium]MBX3391975.1 TatD family hydrolase [Phycisphaeraceae bacterium]